MDIQKIIDGIAQNLETIADTKGTLRSGAIWATANLTAQLKEEIKKQLAAKDAKIEELKGQLEIIQKGE